MGKCIKRRMVRHILSAAPVRSVSDSQSSLECLPAACCIGIQTISLRMLTTLWTWIMPKGTSILFDKSSPTQRWTPRNSVWKLENNSESMSCQKLDDKRSREPGHAQVNHTKTRGWHYSLWASSDVLDILILCRHCASELCQRPTMQRWLAERQCDEPFAVAARSDSAKCKEAACHINKEYNESLGRCSRNKQALRHEFIGARRSVTSSHSFNFSY